MKHLFLCGFLISLAAFCLAQPPVYNPSRLFPPARLKADLAVLKQKLTTHPALYRYWSKAAFEAFFDSLDKTLTHPMTEQQFLSVITLAEGRIRDGHTMILPSEKAIDYLHTRARLLPLSVSDSAGHLLVVENNSTDEALQPGDEIISINGIGAPAVLAALLDRLTRDGYNLTYPVWQLDHYFSSYYSFTFGEPQTFTLEIQGRNGEHHTRQVAALTRDSVRAERQLRYPDLAAQTTEGQGITLKETADGKQAKLTVKSFDPDVLQETYKQVFEQAIDSLFLQLEQHHTSELVLDLRDNQGGNFEQGRYLVSWLSTAPCQYLLDGPESRLIQPHPHHYTGQLTVLVNGGSFSNTAIVCATLQRDHRAVFAGEEMGGNKRIISGDPEEHVLPFTKIRCYISTADFHITRGVNDGHGLIPEYRELPANAPAGRTRLSAPGHSS